MEETEDLKSTGKFAVKEEGKKPVLGFIAIAAVFLVVGILAGGFLVPQAGLATLPSTSGNANAGNSSAVADKTIKYLNDNFFSAQGVEAKLSSVTEEFGMYNVAFDVYKGTEKQGSMSVYASKDGKEALVASQVLELDTPVTQPAQTGQQFSYEGVAKPDTPLLEAFIVSNCPFGLQMQRLLAPVATGLAQNIKVRYLGSIVNGKITSMHGDAEAQENLRQICIREEQSDKYWAYVAEYIKAGNVDSALSVAGIDKISLDSCMADPQKGLKYAQADFDRVTELTAKFAKDYSVTQEISFPSPAVVLNSETTLEFSSQGNYYSPSEEFAYAAAKGVTYNARSAENVKNLLCDGFNTMPAACSAKLSEEQAATSFSEQYSGGSSTGGSCGS
ncbi:MAG: hypothetical protein PHD95_01825 [Candidatus ainarchaeum sp.]|nr:hypothetical protein [Candidatus ainarchaeum sp.]